MVTMGKKLPDDQIGELLTDSRKTSANFKNFIAESDSVTHPI